MKYSPSCILLSCLIANCFSQEKKETSTHRIKTMFYIETTYNSPTVKHVDTIHFEAYNIAQKPMVYNSYTNNRVSSSMTLAVDQKNRTTAIFEYTGKVLTGRQDFFYDNKGNIILSVKHHFSKGADGKLKETAPDSSRQTFDKAGNKLSIDNRPSRITWCYDAQNRAVEKDFYLQRDGKAQKTLYRYQGKLLMETLYYWYDGKLYDRMTNTYNEHQQLVSARDSTTGFFKQDEYTYSPTGVKYSELSNKTFQGKSSKTETVFGFDGQGRVLSETYHSNDRLLSPLFPFSYRLKAPDFELKQSYSYDQYGNGLKITTELNGEVVRVIDFQMTYY